MTMDTETTLLVLGLAALGWLLLQPTAPAPDPTVTENTDPPPDPSPTADSADPYTLDGIMAAVKNTLGLWRAPAQYAGMIASAEAQNGIPSGLLERLLYQECRYRNDIITGAVRSPVGALGIAQFMPLTARDLGIDPLDPGQAIPAAGLYLSRLYRATGSWRNALAAYNWGVGNVTRKGMASAPTETRNYVAQITADVPVA